MTLILEEYFEGDIIVAIAGTGGSSWSGCSVGRFSEQWPGNGKGKGNGNGNDLTMAMAIMTEAITRW